MSSCFRCCGNLRLVMEKVEIGNICFLFGISEIVFTEMFIELSYMFHMNFVSIAEFGRLPGQHKRYVFFFLGGGGKIFKNPLLRNRKWDARETLHTYLLLKGLQKLCFYCRSSFTFVAMATYSFHRLTLGKVELYNFCCLTEDI